MSTNFFSGISLRFPKDKAALEAAYQNCSSRKQFVSLNKENYIEHLALAKDDLLSIANDFKGESWRWVIVKSYYASFHATNALLVKKLGFFSKDHSCAILALKRENLISPDFYKQMEEVYERFSDIFGFVLIFEARKLSQYDVLRWRSLTRQDAEIAHNFAKKYISYVEEECT